MLFAGDLGFSSLVLAALCVILPAIGFYIRRKCQVWAAKNEEIQRRLIWAAEETARAEREASFDSAAAAIPAAIKGGYCAVCYVPATARCAQCKSVRYCSFGCQTVHWRQGHKFACRPPGLTHQSDDAVSDTGKRVVEQVLPSIPSAKPESEAGTQGKTSNAKPPISDTIVSPKVLHGNNDNVRAEYLADGNITDCNSEVSSNSFSGFSASTSPGESSDDSSVCESIISNEHDRTDGHSFVDSTLDIPDNTPSDMGLPMTSSPKFASLVDSVGGFSTMRKLNQIKTGLNKEECKLASNGNSGSSMRKAAIIEPSSGFWDKTLQSSGIKDDAINDLHTPLFVNSSGNKNSDAGSSFHFSFSTMPPLRVQDIKAKDSVSYDASPSSAGNCVPCSGPASSEKGSMKSSMASNYSYMDSTDSNVTSCDTAQGSESDQLESKNNSRPPVSYLSPVSSSLSKDSVCADSLSIHTLQSAVSTASKHVAGNRGSTLKSSEIRRPVHELSDSSLATGTEGHSNSSTKSVNIGIQSSMGTYSQGVSCSANPKGGLKTSLLKVVDQITGSNLSKRPPLAVGIDMAGRYSGKGPFPYELFVKIYNSNNVELRPFGLINCGNSCYANAILQCLAYTPPLTAYFLQGLHSKACTKNNCCFTCELESLILKSKDTKSPLSPIGVLSQLQSTGSQLGNGKEEDAHEFLRHAIDTMQSVCRLEARVNASGSLEEDTTLMGLTFGGYLRSKIKCMKCGGKSEHQERMMDLTVEIEGEITTLEEAIRRFTSTETLDGENKYHCVRCKSYEKAKKKLTVSEAPNVLTIALKRFQSGKFGKLNKAIKFPEILDLAPFMSGTSDKSPIYRLYGVVVHLDIMNAAFSGHYVCYVKNIQNKWFKVDDSVVTAVDVERVLTKGAYMLFYARFSPRAPRSIRDKIVSQDSKSKVKGKTVVAKSPYIPTNSGATADIGNISPDSSPTVDSFYSKFHRLRRILEEDTSSDNSSLISNNSDEGSCSTDSTRDSSSTDDLSEYIFGESGHGWSNMWRNSESDASSSWPSSPLNSRHSPLADMDRYDSVCSPETDVPLYRMRLVDDERKGGGVPHSQCDTLHQRKLDSGRISSGLRETQRLGSNHFNVINSGVSCRKSRERTD